MSDREVPDRAAEPGVATQPWHFLQSDLWARHKESFGWTAVRVPLDDVWPAAPDLLSLSRRLPGGLLLTYVPYGPTVVSPAGGEPPAARAPSGRAATDDALASDLPAGVPGPGPKELGATLDTIALRVEQRVADRLGRRPTIVRFDLPQVGAPASLASTSLRRSPISVQPPDTVLLDLSADDDALLSAMHKKNRYNLRLAEKKGVSVFRAPRARIDEWYELYRKTAARDAIAIHSRGYYASLLELAEADGTIDIRLYLAEHDRDLLAGIIVVHYRDGATYLYGASSNEKRNLMPNYALQWHAISRAKEEGLAWYDLFGVPPADDPGHPMHGLYRFKTGFGGDLVHRLGAWDSLRRPLASRAYRVAERLRDVYFHRVRRHVARAAHPASRSA
ncbi:MAG: lipid II:glycine glycyltransferase FemX [Spirochaetota bacterium]